MFKIIRSMVSAAAIVAASTCGASAGGLFGDGGLIGGDVGRFVHDNVQAPILTPMVQGAVTGATTAAGNIVGGPIGGLVGGYVGDTINDRFAGGGNPIGRPAQGPSGPAMVPPPPSNYGQLPPVMPAPGPVLGNACATQVGVFGPGPFMPRGQYCFVMTPMGRVDGVIM
jgi:hypothetical protein